MFSAWKVRPMPSPLLRASLPQDQTDLHSTPRFLAACCGFLLTVCGSLACMLMIGGSMPAFAQLPTTKYDSIRFTIATGGDDLRGDSSASAQLFSVNGQPLQSINLKEKDAGSWNNNSTHTVTAKLTQPLAADQIGRIAITLTSHNGTFETNDNWNVNQVSVQLFSGNNVYPLVTQNGNPWVRLTGSQPTASIKVPWQSASGVIYPKYQIYALIYAVPGCTTVGTVKCQNSGLLDYGQGSSNGTMVTTASSFKGGMTVTATEGLPTAGGSESFGVSKTNSSSNSETITKSKNYDLKISGNGDGVDHGQDQFIILTNPSVTLKTLGPTQIGWTMGYDGPIPHFLVLTVQDLRDPAHMAAGKLAVLKTLGFTANDYNELLTQDPLASSPNNPPPGRYSPVAWSFPYSPPNAAKDCNSGICSCLNSTVNISNSVQDQAISASSTDITVGFSAKIPIVPAAFGLGSTTTLTWTNSSSQQNTQSGTQSAAATVACPSPGWSGAQEMDVYWDSVFGSFAFVPYTAQGKEIVQSGQATDPSGRALAGTVVALSIAGKVFHTVTDRNGTYRFHARAAKFPQSPKTGQLTVGSVTKTVPLHVELALRRPAGSLNRAPLPVIRHLQ